MRTIHQVSPGQQGYPLGHEVYAAPLLTEPQTENITFPTFPCAGGKYEQKNTQECINCKLKLCSRLVLVILESGDCDFDQWQSRISVNNGMLMHKLAGGNYV